MDDNRGMSLSTNLLASLRRNFDGQPWHGTSLRRMLDGISDEMAYARSIPNARTIAELLAHTTAWIEIVCRRLSGEEFEVTPDIDFPSVDATTWTDLVRRLESSQIELFSVVEALSEEDLRRPLPGKTYNGRAMLDGLMHHNTYHAAQIAMLKKF
jgi:uncharacterized damage-inducible protein DinB